MKNDLISIIIPVYNGEEYIEKCINSIISQTYDNLEIIVIDDGSTDNTREKLQKILDPRVNKIYIKNNGVSNARNIGIKKAKGKYLMFIDVDDYIDKHTIEILYQTILEKNVDIIRFNGYIQNASLEFTKLEFPIENGKILSSEKDIMEIINIFNYPSKSLRCYSPLLFMKNENIKGFNTKLTYLEDKVFYLENLLSSNRKILFLNKYFYYYTYNNQSKTKNVDNFCTNIKDILSAESEITKVINKYTGIENDIVNASTVSLIIYRINYLAENTKYFKFRGIIKDVFDINEVLCLFKNKYIQLNKIQKIQLFLLRNKLYYLDYLLCGIKQIIQKWR
ncbi:MAG: glycosyltransferase family 2 protein [Bacilli bacterium]|nr:glycosyltransferase family 2 protein [Bacilli bacterium]